ncbi:kynurenine--oxoglutarate transaminase 3-like [Patiria miniata]|uniref:Aminotransferase class I/classII large domain-containing protein n=1 Tax=Patiria miniata TaxID=46514 RepID=A0A913Z433_PATMI|nr:kynurenine--oxoglutarate transaminase 3-like [Patiria miniata]XP_038046549.1 kynurenine--oxoglutarate transaminase 3-like [Patiria miniata]XP_038046550.1 kynurenine--oxoglutarate transaminase 3-like [Patiria miniata]
MLCRIRPALTRFVSESSPFRRPYVQQPALTALILPCSSCFQQRYCHHSNKRKMSSHGPAKRLDGQKTSVWTEFVKLSSETKAINLGQGFPDFAAPDHVKKALIDVATSSNPLLFQYTRGFGHPRMVNAIAALYGKLMGREIDPMEEMLVTVGAYQSLFSTFMSLIGPGDEVIIIEPFFDCYEPMVMMAEGTPRFIALKPKNDNPESADDFQLDPEELAGLFNEKTKAIVVNTPNNPLGKVYKRRELEMIADLCKKHDVLCISDEVYEFMIYSGHEHIRMATLPDMWERTLTICSAGKIFSVTGFKLGWAIGPTNLMDCLKTVGQNCSYTSPTPLQEAVAHCLELELSRLGQPDCYLTSLAKELEVKRDKLAGLLRDIGLSPIMPQGSYFMLANVSHLDLDLSDSGDGPRDYKIVRWITRNLGVATIPCSAFYCEEHRAFGEKYIRFCFIKEDSTIEKAAEKLRKWKDAV